MNGLGNRWKVGIEKVEVDARNADRLGGGLAVIATAPECAVAF